MPVDDGMLVELYAYPDRLDRPYLRVNFVSSADGAVTVGGVSAGLGSPVDRKVFLLLRELADVVLVGAGTVRTEGYGGARRPTRGRTDPPPIGVVTASAALDPGSRLFTDTRVPPIVFTTDAAPVERRKRLAAAGAEVVVAGEHRVDVDVVLAALQERGLVRVLCEGGPILHGNLIAADAVDELCLTIAPALVGADIGRISHGPPCAVRPMRLGQLLTEDDQLLLRYLRAHG
ncbi:MAG: bifunctional deaminase-reductase domain protein [Pseudonocardia sp.]|nr:bifunctional deaminase-reductase domain protein [Pseudonocardia sp.]